MGRGGGGEGVQGWAEHGQRSQRLPLQEWEILARIQQLQRRCQSYCLSPHPPILAALRAQHKLSEEQR